MAIVQFARFKADQPEEMIKTAKRTKVRYSGVSLGSATISRRSSPTRCHR